MSYPGERPGATTSCVGVDATFALDVVLLPTQANVSVIAWSSIVSEVVSSLLHGSVHHSGAHVTGCGKTLPQGWKKDLLDSYPHWASGYGWEEQISQWCGTDWTMAAIKPSCLL